MHRPTFFPQDFPSAYPRSPERFWGGWLQIVCLVGCLSAACRPSIPKYKIHGQVRYDGVPVPVGSITFEPVEGLVNRETVAVAEIRDGNYETLIVGGPHRVSIRDLTAESGAASGRPLFLYEYHVQVDLLAPAPQSSVISISRARTASACLGRRPPTWVSLLCAGLVGTVLCCALPIARGDPPRLATEPQPPPPALTVAERVHHGQPCWAIRSPHTTWLFDRAGGGLASLLDADGNDWISWRPGGRSAGEFRGIPNCGECFHPGYTNAVCQLRHPVPHRVVIDCQTQDGRYAGRWEFFAQHATFTLLKAEGNYWFLYEGTPGGRLDLERSRLVRAPGLFTTLHEIWSADLPGPEWVFFTDPRQRRALWILHHEDDDHPEEYWPMEENMTVFGFGRKYKSLERYLSVVPARFSIGLCDTAATGEVLQAIQAAVPSFAPAAPQPLPDAAPAERVPRHAAPPSPQQTDLSYKKDEAAAESYARYALTHAGDPARGRQLFRHSGGTQCLACHRVEGEGGTVGPDLTHIGGKFGRPHLIESLLEPSRQIVEGCRTTVIRTHDGQTITGIVKQRNPHSWTVLEPSGQARSIPVDQIEVHSESPQSLMPQGLARIWSAEQFTDLIAYLETLRPGGKATPGSQTTGPVRLPPGFVVRTLATGLTGCTAMEVLPDGDVLVAEQTGTLRLIAADCLVPQPVATLPVDSTLERGLIGVTVAPNLPQQPWIYVCYVAGQPYPHHRVSRLRVAGPPWVATSEEVLVEGDDQRQLGGKVPAGHQGGAIHFGLDGKLYVAIGDQTAEAPAQRLNTFQGKMLRLNPDGSLPEDNPFWQKTAGKYRAIWALGLRNPFTFAVRPTSGELWINDVGGQYEEINLGVAGGN